MGRVFRKQRERVESRALVLRRVPTGEADLVLTLLTPEHGCVATTVRGGRKSNKLGLVEPLHTLQVLLDVTPGRDIATLREAKLVVDRMAITQSIERHEAAGVLLRWARTHIAHAAPDPLAFVVIESGLDALTQASPELAHGVAARAGVRLIEALGYSFELQQCVRCGTTCPPRAAAMFDPAQGGLVCRACGGGAVFLSGGQRASWLAWLDPHDEPDPSELAPESATLLFDVVGRVFDAQAAR